MDLLADVCIPCCLGMGHCMGYVAGKSLEVELHRGLDCGGDMARMLDCMFEGVALSIQWSKGMAAHLEPAFALAFESGSSECARLWDEFLVVVPLCWFRHEHEKMFVVHCTGVVIREDFVPIDCATREGMVADFNRREHKTESDCFVVINSSLGNRFAVMYSLVKGLRAREDVMHVWNAVGVVSMLF